MIASTEGRFERRVGVEAVGEVPRLLLHRDRPPRARRRRPHPRLHGHSGRQVERRRVGDGHPGVRAVEGQGVVELAARRPDRVRDGARVAAPGLVGGASYRSPRRSAQAPTSPADARVLDVDGDVRRGRRVAGCVTGDGGERVRSVRRREGVPADASTGVDVSSAPRLAPSSLNWTPATVPLSRRVRADGDAGAHGRALGRRRERDGGRRRVSGRDAGRLVARRADVSGRVLGGDPVVVGAGGETGVGVARARRLRDSVARTRREAGRRRAVEVVAGDDDVVRGGAPARARPGRARPSPRACRVRSAASHPAS